jgi:O-acetyl-ADP-ribose deacetylase (regulator of RNase III)
MSSIITFTGCIEANKTRIISGEVKQPSKIDELLGLIQRQNSTLYAALSKKPFSGTITYSEKDGFQLSIKGDQNVKLLIKRDHAVQIAGQEVIDRIAPIPPTNYKAIIGSLAALTLAGAAWCYPVYAAVAAGTVATTVAVGSCLRNRASSPSPSSTPAALPAAKTVAVATPVVAAASASLTPAAPQITVEVLSDPLSLKVDALVNAANTSLVAGSGICGAIKTKGGAGIFQECQQYLTAQKKKSVEEGHAMITSAGTIANAKHIIHAVGPVWNSAKATECDQALYNAYYNSLLRADENKLSSIAFPSISTSLFGFPLDRAAPIAIRAVNQFIKDHPHTTVKTIKFAIWSGDTTTTPTGKTVGQAYQDALSPTKTVPAPASKPAAVAVKSASSIIYGNPSHGKGPTIPLQIGTVNVGTLTDANFGAVAKIANHYTLNQPYANAPSEHFTHKGQTVYRPNHNGSHSARQARTLEALFSLVEKHGDAPVQSVYRSLSAEEKQHLKLGAYFLRAGRSDESSHKNPNPDDYYTRSAMLYEAYALQLGASPATIQWVKKLIINSCKPKGVREADIDTNPKNKFGYECLTMVHELDLVRCFGPTSFGKSMIHVKDQLDSYLLKKPALKADEKLLAFAKKLCEATGSRRTFDGATGDTDLFARCGVDGEFCWKQVQSVSLPF